MEKLPLGTRVKYSTIMERRSDVGTRRFTTGKKWVPVPILVKEEKFVRTGKREGIVVGMRVFSNGYNEYLGEEGVVYHRTESQVVYLVAWDISRKIDAVRPEDLARHEDGVKRCQRCIDNTKNLEIKEVTP